MMNSDDRRGIRNIIALGLVSLFTDMSTEMILGLYPAFIVSVLKASKTVLGLTEGLAVLLSYAFRLVSGLISDVIGRRKVLVLIGYCLSNLTKPVLSLARTWVEAVAVRLVDRVGKGVRTAPRDALLSESVEEVRAGIAFGIHRTLDQTGAIIGPLLAFALMPTLGFRGIFLLSLLPGLAAIVTLAVLVEEKRTPKIKSKNYRIDFKVLLNRDFLILLGILTMFSIGAFNFSFVLLRVGAMGVSEVLFPLFYVLINVSHTIVGIPTGYLADKLGREVAILLGYVTFLVTCVLCLSNVANMAFAVIVALIYGVYVGIIETSQRAVIPEYVPEDLRASGYGVYYLLIGISSLVANSIVGFLWDTVGLEAAFEYSLITASISTIALLAFVVKKKRVKKY